MFTIWQYLTLPLICNLLLPYFRQKGNSERKSAKEPKFVGKIRVVHSCPTKKRHGEIRHSTLFWSSKWSTSLHSQSLKKASPILKPFSRRFSEMSDTKLLWSVMFSRWTCCQIGKLVLSAVFSFSHVFPRLFECSDFLLHQDFYPWFSLTSKHQSYQASFRKWRLAHVSTFSPAYFYGSPWYGFRPTWVKKVWKAWINSGVFSAWSLKDAHWKFLQKKSGFPSSYPTWKTLLKLDPKSFKLEKICNSHETPWQLMLRT